MGQKKSFSGRDLGIDLGTANTLVYVRGEGIVLNEPSVVAVNAVDGEVVSIGCEAKRTIGRTPSHIVALRPMKDGVIADFDMAERMLAHFVRKVAGARRFNRPQVVICVPSGTTGIERRAVVEAALGAGARQVHLIEEPMAAAIGAGLPVNEPTGSMIVDIGGGTTEVAVVSMGGIVAARSLRTAGDAVDAAIMDYVKRRHSLLIGEQTAEELKVTIGSAAPVGCWSDELRRLDRQIERDGTAPEAGAGAEADADAGAGVGVGVDTGAEDGCGVRLDDQITRSLLPPDRCRIRGRDQVSGLPKTLDLDAADMRHAIAEPVEAILEAVRHTLDICPPELAGDIMERGIMLTGGGALLRGLDVRFRQELDIPVLIAPNPLNCVADGTGKCVEEYETYRPILQAQLHLLAAARLG
jgi:rod shape-determining protein MreB